jgi:hypothetical protein
MPAYESRRITLGDGAATTLHVVWYRLRATRPRVHRLDGGRPLEEWCREQGVAHAVSGGYAVKPELVPLGELRTGGRPAPHRPFQSPWDERRAALLAVDGVVRIAPRDRLPAEPPGDLLQAGPLLVTEGRSAIADVEDPEGFSATAEEFDQDLTAAREPRLAVGVADGRLLAVAADGRGPDDAGLTLWELADVLVDLAVRSALNLDAGSAGVIIYAGRRVNTPRDDEGNDMDPSPPSPSALVFD